MDNDKSVKSRVYKLSEITDVKSAVSWIIRILNSNKISGHELMLCVYNSHLTSDNLITSHASTADELLAECNAKGASLVSITGFINGLAVAVTVDFTTFNVILNYKSVDGLECLKKALNFKK